MRGTRLRARTLRSSMQVITGMGQRSFVMASTVYTAGHEYCRPYLARAVDAGWPVGAGAGRARYFPAPAADHALRAAGGLVLLARQHALRSLAARPPHLRPDGARLARAPRGTAARQATGHRHDDAQRGLRGDAAAAGLVLVARGLLRLRGDLAVAAAEPLKQTAQNSGSVSCTDSGVRGPAPPPRGFGPAPAP